MSASEAGALFAPAEMSEGPRPIDAELFVRGLQLVRASTQHAIRLQLAMERRDRPVALESVDELMRLDREIGDLVGSLPMAADSHAPEQRRRLIATEKFALAAGRSGPRIAEVPSRWREEPPASPARLVSEDPPADLTREISPRLVVALAFLTLFALAAAFFLFTEAGQAVVAAPAAYEGSSR